MTNDNAAGAPAPATSGSGNPAEPPAAPGGPANPLRLLAGATARESWTIAREMAVPVAMIAYYGALLALLQYSGAGTAIDQTMHDFVALALVCIITFVIVTACTIRQPEAVRSKRAWRRTKTIVAGALLTVMSIPGTAFIHF